MKRLNKKAPSRNATLSYTATRRTAQYDFVLHDTILHSTVSLCTIQSYFVLHTGTVLLCTNAQPGCREKRQGPRGASLLLNSIQENCFLDLCYTPPLQALVRPNPGLFKGGVIKVCAFEKWLFYFQRKAEYEGAITLYDFVLDSNISCYTKQFVLHFIIAYYTVLLCTTHYYSLHKITVYYTVLLCTTQYYLILHNTTLYYTVLLCVISVGRPAVILKKKTGEAARGSSVIKFNTRTLLFRSLLHSPLTGPRAAQSWVIQGWGY